MKNLRHVFILFTIAIMCMFFAIDGANTAILTRANNPIRSFDWLNYIGIVTVAFFGIAAFDVKGKEMGFWGSISSFVTAFIYFKFNLITFTLLYLYGGVMDLVLLLKGENKVKELGGYKTFIWLGIIFVMSIVIKIILDHKIEFNINTILEMLTFALYAVGQLLALKQTIWQFAIWIPKNILEMTIGLLQMNPVAIARNLYFIGMNVFAPINWVQQLKVQNKR